MLAIGTGSAYLYSLVSLMQIYQGNVHAVHALYFEGAGVEMCIRDRDTAVNLQYLDLCGNSIEDLDPIKDLREVEYLNLSKNMLRDIQALRGYRQLSRLDISRNNLYTMDISAIAGMINLEELNLERSKVDNLVYLENAKKLHKLSLIHI